ncbi:30S ribosomal protein S11 [Gigaspora margarita]|uniref:30S ribosomal protein S11 n=1 Tax=Gigaspora margarita TaxID=4874 RepID=A0A8H4ETP7_GIGMA|nr:30S ribosomal protein S11 [Gigaspora margarita]
MIQFQKKKVKLKLKTKKETKKKLVKAFPGVKFSFNNTILDISKENGDILAMASAGSIDLGNKKITYTKKGTPFMAEKVAEEIIRKAYEFGINNVKLQVKNIGASRDIVIKRILLLEKKSLNVEALIDRTPVHHGGYHFVKIPKY